MLYTAGTIGQPKGTLLTPRSVLANALGIIDWLALDETDRLNLVLPLHHINSMVFALSTLLVGGTIILNSRYSVSRFWDVLAQEHATACSIVPTIMLDLLARQRDFLDRSRDLNQLERIMIGSAPVPARAAMRFVETFGVKLIQGYGSTETSLRVTGVPVDLPARLYDQVLTDNAVGTELSHCNVKIAGGGAEGCEGEILVRGPVVARGYVGDDDATADAFRDGWFHTGDLGLWREIDGRRFFVVRGRLKEIIIKGGVNISPIAVENALLSTFPEVKACYVVGVADARMQEDIAAAVVLHDAVEGEHVGCVADRILARAAAGTIAGLSAYESPRYIVPVRPEELPTTSSGKVQRIRLKVLLAQRTGCAAPVTPGSAE